MSCHWIWHFIERDNVTRFICHCITFLKFEMVRWCLCGRFIFYLFSNLEKNQNQNGRWSSICDELIFAFTRMCPCMHECCALFEADEGAKRFICHFNSVCVFKMYQHKLWYGTWYMLNGNVLANSIVITICCCCLAKYFASYFHCN